MSTPRSAPVWLVGLFAAATLLLALFPPSFSRPATAPDSVGLDTANGRPPALRLPVHRAAVFAGTDAFITVDRGVTDLAAIPNATRASLMDSLLGQIYPGIAALPTLFTAHPDAPIPGDPEQLLALRTDAVVAWPGQARALEAAGLSVIYAAPLTSQQAVYRMWRLFGQLSGHAGRVDDLIGRYRAQRARLSTAVAGLPPGHRPRVLIMSMNPGLDSYFVAPRTFVVTRNIAELGAVNAGAGFVSGHIGLEGLIDLRPDVIFVLGDGPRDARPDAWYANPWLQSLPAVRAHRVYALPRLGQWGQLVEHPLTLRWMAELLYPTQMGRTLRAQLREQYRFTYGFVPDGAQIDHLLRMRANRHSAGYWRFAEAGAPDPAASPASTPSGVANLPLRRP